MHRRQVERRQFIVRGVQWLAGGTLLSFVVQGCGDASEPMGSGEPITIDLSDGAYAVLNQVGGAAKVPRQGGLPIVVVRRNAETFVAFSSRCTHQSCEVDLPNGQGELVCPCHGSRYNSNGVRLSGPAREDLDMVEIRTAGSELILDP